MKYYIQYVNPPRVKKMGGFETSLAQPNPMTLREMVERFVRTGDVSDLQGHPTYYDDENLEPRNFDLSDLTEAEAIVTEVRERKKSGRKGNDRGESEAKDEDVPSAPAKSEPEGAKSEPEASKEGEKS